MIDLHCHLDLYDDPHAVTAECLRRNLYVLSVTTTPSAFKVTQALAPKNSRIRTALGLHPELVATRSHELALFEQLLPDAEYVGEIGLDGSAPHRSSLPLQREILDRILHLCAQAGGKKITLHSRGATGQILEALEAGPGAGRSILHWYNGSARQIERASKLGAWFSVSPAMLSSKRGWTTVSSMPQDRVLPETDGPFGTVSGEPAHPWDAWLVVPVLARMWSISEAAVAHQLLANFRVFASQPMD